MSEVTVEEYMDALNGGNYGTQYSKNYYIISRKEKKNKLKNKFC